MTRAPAELRRVADLAAKALAGVGAPEDGDGVAVAVSGGADSLALLHALRVLSRPRRWDLAVLTVDHGLRPGSAADAAFVAAHAAELGVEAVVATADQDELARHRGQGPEAAARAARYTALLAAADDLGCKWVVTGHTRDDQAETLLLALLRGAGPDGLAGMAVVTGRVLRPLLEVTRAQTVACCEAIGVTPRQDETNADERLLRNAVRRRLLPLLEEIRPGAAATLARTAGLARVEREWAEGEAAATLAELRGMVGRDDGSVPAAAVAQDAGGADLNESPDGGETVSLPLGALARLPLGLARRVVRAAASAAGHDVPPAAAVDDIIDLAGPGAVDGARVGWPGGETVLTGGRLHWPGRSAP
jgi:tRNA(Ile)-lysidine synthase